MKRETIWYGVGVSKSGKIITLWECSEEPVPSEHFKGKKVLKTSRGRIAFSPNRIFKVTSMKSYKEMKDRIKRWQKEHPEFDGYSIQTH